MKTLTFFVAAAALALTACGGSSSECASGLLECGGRCVDTDTDHDNCGGCGNACAADERCVGGLCGSEGCPTGQLDCGGRCVDTDSDHDNCGGCGNACGDDQTCRAGACECTGAGLSACGRDCVNTDSDPSNCGVCGTACDSDETCMGGECARCADEETSCNGEDDDCDGEVDEDLTRPCSNPCGEGVETCDDGEWEGCTAPEPATEVCDGEDNDCDGAVDEDVTTTYYEDMDEDGYGDPDYYEEACEPFTHPERGTDYIADNTDCDDVDETIHPGATEICDTWDNDCDGTIDEGCACTDGTTQSCGLCDDGTQTCASGAWGPCIGATPPADEVCDGVDNDCDGAIDEGIPEDYYEINDDCARARALTHVLEGDTVTVDDGTLYSSDGAADVDWYHVVAEELSHIDCGWPWELLPQCYFYFTAELTPPAGATHTDYRMCVRANDCSGSGGTFCTDDLTSYWDIPSGKYVMVLRWEGTCWLDDSFDFFVSVEGASAEVHSCHPYEVSFSLDYSDETCEE